MKTLILIVVCFLAGWGTAHDINKHDNENLQRKPGTSTKIARNNQRTNQRARKSLKGAKGIS